MAGADAAPCRERDGEDRRPSRDTALLIIDMQRDFCEPGGYAAQAGLDVRCLAAPIPNIARLAAAFRRADLPVIYTREGHRPDLSDCPPTKRRRAQTLGAPIGGPGPLGRLLIRGERGHEVVDALRPEPGDMMIDKPGYSAFHATDLDHLLRANGVTTIVVTGVTTDVCVHSTLRAAVDHGYVCVTVIDATACDDPAVQAGALALIAREGGIFGSLVDTDAVLSAIEERAGSPVDPADPERASARAWPERDHGGQVRWTA